MNSLEDLCFELPDFDINGVPLISEDKLISLIFIEVGIRPKGKKSQLRQKKQLILKYWGDNYKRKHGVDWIPQTYRVLAHYNPGIEVELDQRKYELDLVLLYTKVTEDMIKQFTDSEKVSLIKTVKKIKEREIVKGILENEDANALTQLLSTDYSIALSYLRGKIAEVFVFKDLSKCKTEDMYLLPNGQIKYFNKRYKHGTEIDGMITFHKQDSYITLVNSLKELPHLEVYER